MLDRVLRILARCFLLLYLSFCLAVGYKVIHSWFRKTSLKLTRIVSIGLLLLLDSFWRASANRGYLQREFAVYRYSHLKPQEIRLLELYPGRPGDPLVGWLDTASFSDISNVENYEALSYVWGKSSWRKVMVVNGKRLYITRNLYDALNHIRLEKESRKIWVDAICID
jgi:hypothetical protein